MGHFPNARMGMTFVAVGTTWQTGPGIFPALSVGQQCLHFTGEGQSCQEVRNLPGRTELKEGEPNYSWESFTWTGLSQVAGLSQSYWLVEWSMVRAL